MLADNMKPAFTIPVEQNLFPALSMDKQVSNDIGTSKDFFWFRLLLQVYSYFPRGQLSYEFSVTYQQLSVYFLNIYIYKHIYIFLASSTYQNISELAANQARRKQR